MTAKRWSNFAILRRRLSSFLFVLSLVIWLLAMAAYTRSKFRADLFTLVTPGHHCVVVDWDEGLIELVWQSPWPGPKLFAWSGAKLTRDVKNELEYEALRGPDLTTDTYLYSQQFPNTSALRFKQWRDFLISYGTVPCVYTVNDSAMTDSAWRVGYSDNGGSAQSIAQMPDNSYSSNVDLKEYFLRAPIWVIPSAASIFPCLWLIAAGRRRFQQLRRKRKGQCIQCGYDLRETPTRCPECGEIVSTSVKNTREWIHAFAAVAAMLLSALFYVRWAERSDPAGVPVGDRTHITDPGVNVAWAFDADRSSLVESALSDSGKYTVRVDLPSYAVRSVENPLTTVSVLLDGKTIRAWHDLDAFKIRDNILYGAHFGPYAGDWLQPTGGTIWAFDLSTGKQLWRSVLRDCPPKDPAREGTFVGHYLVQLGLDVAGDKLLVWGEETGGRYLELKNIHTGESIGHHYYEITQPFRPPDLEMRPPDTAVEGQPCTFLLIATPQQFELRSVDHWTVDWKDGKGGSSDIISYSYPAGADRKQPLSVSHTFNPDMPEVSPVATAVVTREGSFDCQPISIALAYAPPNAVRATTRSATEIDLAWVNASRFALYTDIYISKDGTTWEPVIRSPVSVTENHQEHFHLTGLAPGTRYWFELKSVGASESDATAPVSTMTGRPEK